MFKDKDKQREANRQAQARQRAKGMTKGMTNQGMTARSGTASVIPCRIDCVAPHSQCHTVKRGKDIKCFADLPADVQESLNRMSKDNVGRIDEAKHKERTAVAIRYHHLFPDKPWFGIIGT